ncbi:MAG TPA: hypothetical protein VEZ52_12165 [Desulfovibrio sp.]|uniref:hypothetical protein n=1 Tax=Desulfovibrio sp. TaxID=885 RepID=UPI002D3DC695|nr:hypothetical protein [Desulfovibrio sp.]HZF62361.1 hypothetical protein [Desulfovibrio sp.]
MPQSPELAGGEGFTYEGNVAAFYLAALLAEAYAPGIEDRIVCRVSVQQRDFGEPLDDVIVDFKDTTENEARLSLQIKRSLTVSNAESNNDFRDIIRDSWATFKKNDFRFGIDRYGPAVGTISSAKERALKTLCDWARESLTTEHFNARFAPKGSASEEIRDVKDAILSLLEKINGTPCADDEAHHFLAHLVLIQFDFLREGNTDSPEAINRIRECLAPNEGCKAPLVWGKMIQWARESAGKSGQFNRIRLVKDVSHLVQLRGAPSIVSDLNKLTELARSYVSLIPDDISGINIERSALLDDYNTKLSAARLLQIRGLPGSGKSVIMRQAVERSLEHGPTIFIKAEQLEGTSWISYAISHGLSNIPLERLLVEVGAAGTNILFIDAIDRVERKHQPIILDLFNTIAKSPLLSDWRIVVSLRDSGVEILRNWLGAFIDTLRVKTLQVEIFDDQESEILANKKPQLRSLLFGTDQVRNIVRRPFFAKILNEGYLADPSDSTFAPQSEIDLIENWWRRGGYNEIGQNVAERQRTLLELAKVRVSNLSQPIFLSRLSTINHLDALRVDGILQDAREGISVRFTHDIFFEWAFFYVLTEASPQWMDIIKNCGEPPAVARVVELISQWEYTRGNDWGACLEKLKCAELRSQWLRAWLLGPLGTSEFDASDALFASTTFIDDFYLFKKVLVWFQAEKTIPNSNVMSGIVPNANLIRMAYLFAWPSDLTTWRRLIAFIIRRIQEIPQRLYPEIISIFEVWQHALSGYKNPTSHAILKQCSIWLSSVEDEREIFRDYSKQSKYWNDIRELSSFHESLVRLILLSVRSEPEFVSEYLQRVTNQSRIEEKSFHNIIAYSGILSQTLSKQLVDISLAFLLKELPEERISRDILKQKAKYERRKSLLAKPEAERTEREQLELSSPSLLSGISLDSHDWDKLSLDDHRFFPSSPIREPFHSLFQAAPKEGLRLVRELCNHAITAWRQLHRCLYKGRSTPIPLEIKFPWGTQKFWGNDREYLWCRSVWPPHILGCALMALEEWCCAELERGVPVDELIKTVVEENECVAILGVAAMIALQTKTVSEAVFPLISSQRLLDMDKKRWVRDCLPSSSLIGFTKTSDKPHAEAVEKLNGKEVRRKTLSWMIPRFIFFSNPDYDQKTRDSILGFQNELPFEYEEHRDNTEINAQLTAQAIEYAELVDRNNYHAQRVDGAPDQIAIVHVSPTKSAPESMAKAEEASKRLEESSLYMWAEKSLKKSSLDETYTVEKAIASACEIIANGLFRAPQSADEDILMGMTRGSVAATAAIVLNFRKGRSPEELDWARDVLQQVARFVEQPFSSLLSKSSVVPWHHSIFLAHGLAAELREGTESETTAQALLELLIHPQEIVSLAAFDELCKLWDKNPKLTWLGIYLVFSLCCREMRPYDEEFSPSECADPVLKKTIELLYNNEEDWPALPALPDAWVKVLSEKNPKILRRKINQKLHQHYDMFDVGDDPADDWTEPDIRWNHYRAKKFLEHIPYGEILKSQAGASLVDFLSDLLDWTIQKNSPPWETEKFKPRPAAEFYEWTHALGRVLGSASGAISFDILRSRLLDPILKIEGEACWSLLAPFVDIYIRKYVYDAPIIHADAKVVLELCLEHMLCDKVFQNGYSDGRIWDYDLPDLARSLMFISVEYAGLAARYVNGDWSGINFILPIVDRFIRVAGWSGSVMSMFLTLCERSKANYPAEAFADQLISVISNASNGLVQWHDVLAPARIAELVHYMAHRDSPMPLTLAQKFLRILDWLVDMGDRRSAALQLSESFRDVRVPCAS